jgi:hypothetical protein
MARKSMAAAAVSVASLHLNLSYLSNTSQSNILRDVSCRQHTHTRRTENARIQSANWKNDIIKAATWLTRAESLMSNDVQSNHSQKYIEDEMEVIASLIEEAPEILLISTDLPKLLECKNDTEPSIRLQANQKLHSCPELSILSPSCAEARHSEKTVSTSNSGQRKRSLSNCDDATTDSPTNPMKILASLSSQAAPLNTNNTKAVADDATAFVNFLQSVVHVNKV